MPMSTMDDRKIDEIVAKVVAKLAPALGVGPVTNPRATPAPAEVCGPSPALISRAPMTGRGGGRRGIYDDVDSAVKAARAAHAHLAGAGRHPLST